MDKKQEFLKRILATFKIEAEENINKMSSDLIELEKNPPDPQKKELVEVIYRSSHSLKGAARAVNLNEIESLCHAFEGVMSEARSGKLEFDQQIIDFLLQTVDLLEEILHAPEGELSLELNEKIVSQIKNLALIEAGEEFEVTTVLKSPEPETQEEISEPKIEQNQDNQVGPENVSINKTTPPNQEKSSQNTKTAIDETIRISTDKLDKLLFQAEEMLAIKLSAIQRSENLQKITEKLSTWSKESLEIGSSVRNIKQTVDKQEKEKSLSKTEKEIHKAIKFYEWSNSHIQNLEKDLADLQNFSSQDLYSTELKIDSLLEDVKNLITVPFSNLLDVFPKMVRDISKDLAKEIAFNVVGEDTEIDRRILEKIRHPLLHILRNSIDYGIENPEERIKKGKPKKGNITLKIEQLESNKVEIKISDDGAGINIEKLKALYIKNENIAEKDVDKINEKEYLNYIFRSGVSTSKIVTDLSGRGLGLAIVMDSIEQLGGTVNVETVAGKSSTFRFVLPLSLVTFRGVLLTVSDKDFIVPASKALSVQRLDKQKIKTIKNKDTMPFNDEFIPLVNLCSILELQPKENGSQYKQVIVIEFKERKIGFTIDKVIGEQEVLVKSFNKQLSRVRNISGATILGSGKVVPILKVADLFQSSLNISGPSSATTKSQKDDSKTQKSVLVVEDSITSRMLLKNILEATGYEVTTAIDGIDGFTKLKEGVFNAVISDVEMPRMNGFELTAKIRADKQYAELPVILVTSLSKREHKERGIDVGANGYIVKSSFDQSNLLEILDRLI